jgi:hypothetical protein
MCEFINADSEQALLFACGGSASHDRTYHAPVAATQNAPVKMLSHGLESFDRRDDGVGDAANGRDAGARRASSDMHGAGAAHGMSDFVVSAADERSDK